MDAEEPHSQEIPVPKTKKAFRNPTTKPVKYVAPTRPPSPKEVNSSFKRQKLDDQPSTSKSKSKTKVGVSSGETIQQNQPSTNKGSKSARTPAAIIECRQASTTSKPSQEIKNLADRNLERPHKKRVLESSEEPASPQYVDEINIGSEVYNAFHRYSDLGYVASSLEVFGVAKGSWRTRCCSFSFVVLDSYLSPIQWTSIRQSTHFRLILSESINSSFLVLPRKFASRSKVPYFVTGNCVFSGAEDKSIDALRHFAQDSIRVETYESIPIPQIPKKGPGNTITIKGVQYPWKVHGVIALGVNLILTKDQKLHFVVGSFSDITSHQQEIRIDVYLTEAFLHADAEAFSEVPGHHRMADYERLKFLFESGRAIDLNGNPFLESLVLEKKYDPRFTAAQEQRNKVFGEHIKPQVVADLFASVKESHADQQLSELTDPQHKLLRLKMHNYQKRAVSWMMVKERASLQRLERPDPLYIPFETMDGDRLFIHYSSSRVVKTLPTILPPNGGILADEMGLGKTLETISLILSNPKTGRNPRLPSSFQPSVPRKNEFQCVCQYSPDNPDFVPCAKCGLRYHKVCVAYELIPKDSFFLCITCQREHRIESKATLVVAPQAIIEQWKSEINKSTQGLQVYEYSGIYKKTGYISPWSMCLYDIVLASYEMLSNEILYLHAEDRKATLRKASTRAVPPTPLLSIKFWRFVLDEAQMVESQTSNYALFAMKISAQFYWAVTGTPIQRGISDLRPLLNFVEVFPWNQSLWFSQFLAGPFEAGIQEPLHDVLADSMWRLEKSDVEGEMDLPPCTTVEHVVHFTGIEKQLYQEVYQDCVKVITSKLRTTRLGAGAFDEKYTNLDWDLFKIIRTWITHLQKLCTSPTRVGYFFNIKKKQEKDEESKDGDDSLARVAATLLKRAKDQLQNTVRACIMTKNALGGLYWLLKEFSDAAASYREAKHLWKESENYFPVDTSQKLHILTNLGELMTAHHDTVPPTLEDLDLLEQARVLSAEARAKHSSILDAACKRVKAGWVVTPAEYNGQDVVFPHSQKDLKNVRRNYAVVCQGIAPIYSVMKIFDASQHDHLIQYIRLNSEQDVNPHLKGPKGTKSKSKALNKTFNTLDGVGLVLQSRWDDIVDARKDVCDKVAKLMELSLQDDQQLQTEAAACHLRVPPSPRRCDLCRLEKAFNLYEDLIFLTIVQDGHIEDDDEHRAYRKHRKFNVTEEDERDTRYVDGDFEVTCKTLVQFARRERKKELTGLEDEVKRFFQMMELMKKEQKSNRFALKRIYDYVAGCDEMKQSVMRLRFMTEDEEVQFKNMAKTDQKTYQITNALMERSTDVFAEIRKNKSKFTHEQTKLAHDASHYRYISNMHDAYTQAEDVERRTCCICLDVVEENWALLPCYHILCVGCLKQMQIQSKQDCRPTVCPLCRKQAPDDQIVSTRLILRSPTKTEKRVFTADKLRGVPSKMEVVVNTVRDLIDVDSFTKILMFSEYTDVLEDYEKLFHRVGITAKFVKLKSEIPSCVANLRIDKYNILLMPVALGGKGLTIIEANHIFFLEPLMNKASELQAIGRIHRMGQVKPTFVHKFIVEDTIEEKIHEMMSNIGAEGSVLQQDLTLREILDILKSSGHHGPANATIEEWINLTDEDEESVNHKEKRGSDNGVGPSTSHAN